jgi:hypothetical protein
MVLDAAAVLRFQSPKTALNPVLGFHKRRMVDHIHQLEPTDQLARGNRAFQESRLRHFTKWKLPLLPVCTEQETRYGLDRTSQ